MKHIASRLSSFYFFYFMVMGSFMPFWNAFLEKEGYSKAIIGLLGTIPVLTRIVAPGVWGYLADKTQERMRLVQVAALMQLVTWLVLSYVIQDLPILIAVLFIYSFFQNAILSQFEAVALYWLDYHPQRYGAVRLWGSLGFVVAVMGLGLWFNTHSLLQLPNWLLFFALLALFMSLVVPNPPKQAKELVKQPIGNTLKQPAVLLFFVIEFLLLFSHAPFYTFYTNYLQQYHYSSGVIGFLWGAGVIAEVLMLKFNAPFTNRYSIQTLTLVCIVLTGVRWAIVGLYPSYFYMQLLAQCIHAFSFGLFQIISMQFLHRYFSPLQQGRAQGLYSMTWGLAVGVGGILSGQLWDTLTGPMLFLLAAGICILAAVVAGVGFNKINYGPRYNQ